MKKISKPICNRVCTNRSEAPAHGLACAHRDYCVTANAPVCDLDAEQNKEDMADKCRICGTPLTPDNHYKNEAVCKKCRYEAAQAQRRAKKKVEEAEDESREQVASTLPSQDDVLTLIEDIRLKEELERRGWNVVCTKTITL